MSPMKILKQLREAAGRGQDAASPVEIPLPGWLDIARRLFDKMGRDYIGLVAAGMAFYLLMAIFPALAAAISIYGLVSNDNFVAEQISAMDSFLPPDALRILQDQASSITQAGGKALSFSLLLSILLTIYSSTKGVKALIQGFNIAYNEHEKRNFIVLNVTCFALTALMMVYMLVALAFIAALPAIVHFFPFPDRLDKILLWSRWPLLFFIMLTGLQILYRFGPSRARARWRWVSAGSFCATALWLGGSALFSLFVSNFGNYNATYGSISAVIILLMWFWMSAMVVLIGAEINAVIELQTGRDTTTGREKPIGARGAYVADTVPDAKSQEG